MSTSEYQRLPTEGKDASAPSAAPGRGNYFQQQQHRDIMGDMQILSGSLPFIEPNVRSQYETQDLQRFINTEGQVESCTSDCLWSTLCCVTMCAPFYLATNMTLVNEGQYALVMNNGKPQILTPGRHMLRPLASLQRMVNSGDDLIVSAPITIARVPQGSIGLAYNDGQPELLLPGRHVRKSASFRFLRTESLSRSLIQEGPIKLFTVKTGEVRVCYRNGKVEVMAEGRFAVNDPNFEVAHIIYTQQQNVRFQSHQVLLDGGISMLVEGLLTFQVIDVERLLKQLGASEELLRSIQDVTKAELSRVFAGVHLEDISSSGSGSGEPGGEQKDGLLGNGSAHAEGEYRTRICDDVIKYITPLTTSWGVKIITFQLESTRIADRKYASEYEEASLALAKAKANRRAVAANNQILLQKTTAQAESLRIEALGKKTAVLIEAEGQAEARKIDAKARNDAAAMMDNEFAKTFALNGLQVDFAKSIKANVLTVTPSSVVGQALVNSPFGSQQMS